MTKKQDVLEIKIVIERPDQTTLTVEGLLVRSENLMSEIFESEPDIFDTPEVIVNLPKTYRLTLSNLLPDKNGQLFTVIETRKDDSCSSSHN